MPLSSVVGAQSIVKPGVCTSTTRPASPYDGQVIYMTDVDQTAVWDGTAWVVLAPIAGGRNVIINGAMQIAQRGTSFSFATGAGALYYGADRFETVDYTWTAGSNITVSQETSVLPTGFHSAYKIATGATGLTFGSGGVMRIRTKIEGFNMRPNYSKTMTLSFWVRSSIAGTYNLFLENGNWDASTTTRAYQPEYTINSANTWEKKSITIDMASATSAGTWNTTNGIGLGITWALGANANRTGDAYKNGWTTYSSIHMQTSTGTQWATNANATFYLTGVQLEAGAVATPFEFEDFGTTLAKCQRYFQSYSGSRWDLYSQRSGDEAKSATPSYVTPMRATPTVTLTDTAPDGGPTLNVTAYLYNIRVYVTSTSGSQAPYFMGWTASAEL